MPNNKHYFIEETDKGKFAVRAKDSKRASALLPTQEEAIREVQRLNPNDHPDVERVRNTDNGVRDQWRTAS